MEDNDPARDPADSQTLQKIRDLKTNAKNRRDAGRYERAVKYLQMGADLALGGYDTAPADYARELADIYGIWGGIRRRQADAADDGASRHAYLRQSYGAYDRGLEYEREELGVVASHNLVNRLVSRILNQPAALAGAPLKDDPQIPPTSLMAELEDACRTVEKQLAESRRGDVWAMADHALLSLLTSESTNAATVYGPLHRMAPPSYVYTSVLSTLRTLADVASDYRPELDIGVRDLESRLGE